MRKSQVNSVDRERIVKGYEGSGSTLSDYCVAQDISLDQYYKWRRDLFGPKYKKGEKSTRFVELGCPSISTNQDQSPLHLEIEIAGITIRVRK